MSKKAFTLIELLIVMVTIGILASLLIPAMGRAREGARRAICVNNLRQHGIAWHLCLDDNNGVFPPYGNPVGPGSIIAYQFGGKPADRLLDRYLDIDSDNSPNMQLFHCPDDMKPSQRFLWSPPSSSKSCFDLYGNSYISNLEVTVNLSAPYTAKALSSVKGPPSKVYMEMCTDSIVPGHGGRGSTPPRTPVMVLFLDGHAGGPFLYYQDFGPDPAKPVYTERLIVSF